MSSHPIEEHKTPRHRTRAKVAAVVVGVALAALARPSAAQGTAAVARAQSFQRFEEVDRLMREGRYERACDKLAESHRLDPQLGSLLYMAECYEKIGRLASAWGAYREGEEIALRRGDERAAMAGERARALEPRLNRMVFELPAGEHPAGYEITREGLPVSKALWDTAMPVDSGRHRVEVRAPGYEPFTTDVEVEGQAQRVVVRIPVLEPAALARPTQPGGVPPSGDSQRIAAIAVGGLGLLGLGVSGFFGLSAQGSFSDSGLRCNERHVCDERGVALRQDADEAAIVANISAAIGAAALLSAALLWFTAADAEEAQSAAGTSAQLALEPRIDGVGLGVSGAF